MKENFVEGTSWFSNRIEIDCFAHTIDSCIFPSKYRFYGRSVNIRTVGISAKGVGLRKEETALKIFAAFAGFVPRKSRSIILPDKCKERSALKKARGFCWVPFRHEIKGAPFPE